MTAREESRPGVTDDTHPLDNPCWFALTGPHAGLALSAGDAGTGRRPRRPQVLAYPRDVSPFVALSPDFDDDGWAELAAVVGPGGDFALPGTASTLDRMPADWERLIQLGGVQMVATDELQTAPDPDALVLGAEDVEDMLELVARTKPGPFLPHTYELGTYLGFRRAGALVAMAGERMHPAGWSEISAVCTDPGFRGQGLAARLIRAVAHGIRARGERPFLHTTADNANAIRLYETLGFVLRRPVVFHAARIPAAGGRQ
jgi:ribosomal protein S18 acetylase RimI-like enzyme